MNLADGFLYCNKDFWLDERSRMSDDTGQEGCRVLSVVLFVKRVLESSENNVEVFVNGRGDWTKGLRDERERFNQFHVGLF